VLASLTRSTFYASHLIAGPDEQELVLLVEIDAEYTRHPFYGSRKMVVHLRGLGHLVNRKRVQRLMRLLGLAGMAPGPNTSHPHPQHKVYPYLLRGVTVTRPNQRNVSMTLRHVPCEFSVALLARCRFWRVDPNGLRHWFVFRHLSDKPLWM